MEKNKIITGAAALAFVVGAGVIATGANAGNMGAGSGNEKCSGIVKAGKNDCAANGHSCAGMSRTNNQAGEWIKVPTGTCAKITGGVLVR